MDRGKPECYPLSSNISRGLGPGPRPNRILMKKPTVWPAGFVLAFALAAAPRTLGAQLPAGPPADTLRPAAAGDTAVPPRHATEWVPIGTPAEDRLRTAQLLGEAPTAGFLIRSVSSATQVAEGEEGARLLRPHVRGVWNSYLPMGANDGLAWNGRGGTVYVSAGVRARFGGVTVIAAPEVAYAQNREFQRVYPAAGRSSFANPFHGPASPLDAPLRFGPRSFTQLSLGQSSVTARFGSFAAGGATENLWWGPGIRNALVMSNNASGFPHLFVRTRPEGIGTRFGTLQGQWVSGALGQSGYSGVDDDGRTLAGIALAFTPRGEPGLTLGLTRAVYRTGSAWGAPLRFLDVFAIVSHPEAVRPPRLEQPAGRSDQLFSLFGRWVFPASGFETYGEWARQQGFGSFSELVSRPGATSGYTLGMQWVATGERRGRMRLQAEITSLEQNDAVRGRRQQSFYTSVNVPQGYTHRGQVLGAAIGPGSSAQWAAADYLRPDWRLGVFLERTRWDEDALERISTRNPRGHDTQGLAGVRAGRRFGGWELASEYSFGRRLNWLFQNTARSFFDFDAVDLNVSSFTLSVSPALR